MSSWFGLTRSVGWNAMIATLNPGDEVIVPTPYWVSYWDIVLLAGGAPVAVDTSAATRFASCSSREIGSTRCSSPDHRAPMPSRPRSSWPAR